VALKDWVLQKLAMKEKVTHDELREKAMEMIIPYNPDFQCSQGWITRFLYRHEINLKTKVIGKIGHMLLSDYSIRVAEWYKRIFCGAIYLV